MTKNYSVFARPSRYVLSMALLGQLSACASFFFTDAVAINPPTPLEDAARHNLSNCQSASLAKILASKSDEPAGQLAIELRQSCSVEETQLVAAARSETGWLYARDVGHGIESMNSAFAREIATSRAMSVAAEAIHAPPPGGNVPRFSREEFKREIELWDQCLSSAAIYFARGNPRDPADQLAVAVEGFCWNLQSRLAYSNVEPPLGDAYATATFVEKHARDHLPVLTALIAQAQTNHGK